ncbi:outer membrane beta-barrel protein [Spirosoma utsteinense]|nr:outer membrane beta-barrel protein [Spirosoma utsteinense]MBC3788926.1 outer membrane protein [Spirosoma utsteinense]
MGYSSEAQTEKGRWSVGTQVGDFSYSDQNNQNAFSGELAPSAGYFVANGLLIGAGIPFSFSTSRSNQYIGPTSTTPVPVESRSIGYGLAPFIQYYIGSAKLKPYLGVSYTYGLTNSSQKTAGATLSKSDGRYSSVSPTLGVAYFVSRYAALSAGVSYNIQRDKSEYTIYDPLTNPRSYRSNAQTFSAGIGFQLFFGQ